MAVEDLYSDLREIMLAYARRCLRDEEAAKDVVSESFMRLIQAEGSLRSRAPEVARAYLFTILRNRIATPRRTTVSFEEWMAPMQEADEADAASRSARVPPEELRRAIERLPESERTPLLLFHFRRLSHKEIASVMGISALAVTMRLFKARRKLRTMLAPPPEDDQ